ncbi:IclR family transcriptional regulator [Arthrobacter sp. zg-Y859]|uniref:IclR family transcriptional regulator n=1 Tax=Arthrobacter jinronghuae TaxID=2964609 RepID=A0ABT1NST4_9MICC|nr:IclR family transcriptional regulator [Arthrobacter jinronghuae]MCQ1950785.1 IclR family transcriptional regulator [Arthrobacter jinronghuae]UWX79254.1 IclR family transcriptional regulator [Arthrobacter jinronghuae]
MVNNSFVSPSSPSTSEKTLMVLEAALEHSRFTEVVSATGFPKATVHRLISTLVERRFVTVDGDGNYLPGPSILALAGKALARIDISSIAQPFVDKLVDDVQCTVHMGAISGDAVIYIVRKDSDKPYKMPSRVGLSVPLHTTAIGKAILATYTDDTVERMLTRAGMQQLTEASITTVADFRRELDDVRRRGTARDRGENVPGIACIGAPVHDHTGVVRYGLSISTLSIEHSDEQIEAMSDDLLAAAAAISKALGYRGTDPEPGYSSHLH